MVGGRDGGAWSPLRHITLAVAAIIRAGQVRGRRHKVGQTDHLTISHTDRFRPWQDHTVRQDPPYRETFRTPGAKACQDSVVTENSIWQGIPCEAPQEYTEIQDADDSPITRVMPLLLGGNRDQNTSRQNPPEGVILDLR